MTISYSGSFEVRWHRTKGGKSHLVQSKYAFRDWRIPFRKACGGEVFVINENDEVKPNNDKTDPCKKCLRIAEFLVIQEAIA